MNPYEFRVSLRISHPTIDPQRASDELGVIPSRYWKVGDKRATPKGTELNGNYSDSYWCADLDEGNTISSGKVSLEYFLVDSSNSLMEYSNFFRELRDSGGSIDYFVSLFSSSSIGCEFSSELLELLCKIGIGLQLDIHSAESEDAGT